MIMVNMPKQSNGDKIIPIKYINNKIIVQKQSADNKIDGLYEFDIKEEAFKEIFTLKNKNNKGRVEMFHVSYEYIEHLKDMSNMYLDVIEYEDKDKVRIKFYEINFTSYNTTLVFEYLVNPGFYYKGISYLRDGFFLFKLGNEKYDDNKHTLHFLYDVKEGKIYPVLDDIFRMTSSSYKIFIKDSLEYLFFDEWYIDFYEEEELISRQSELSKNNSSEIDFDYLFNNSFKVIEINKFIQQIKAGNKNIEYATIDSAKMNGWIRYCGMNENNIYYIRKLYDESTIEIISVSKDDFKLTSIKKLDKIDRIENVCIGSKDKYLVEEIDDKLVIKSLSLDTVVFTYYKNEESKFERFINIVNDMYLIIYGEKENVNEDSEYYKIIKMTNDELICARNVWFQNDTMVLIY